MVSVTGRGNYNGIMAIIHTLSPLQPFIAMQYSYRLFLKEPVNVGQGSDVLYLVPYFFKFPLLISTYDVQWRTVYGLRTTNVWTTDVCQSEPLHPSTTTTTTTTTTER